MHRVVKTLGVQQEIERGSVGVKIGLIVENQCDLYVHLSPRTKQWDTCAPQIILQEANGRLTDLFGEPLLYNQLELQNLNGIVATNGIAHNEVIERLQPLLSEFGRAPV
jgi:3'(2'), 5'-bisphosphate nucleotidase